jgi:predicted RNase H-like nuclease (RuvC/YqgF family)
MPEENKPDISFKAESRKLWQPGKDAEGKRLTPETEDLIFGCMQRIADALEVQTKSYSSAPATIERLAAENQRLRDQVQFWKNSQRAYRGKLTTANKEIENLKEQFYQKFKVS